jgi:hypothetical protein
MAADAAKTNVYDLQEQLDEQWFGDRRAHARMCDALARALRVRYAVMDFVYETRLEELACSA